MNENKQAKIEEIRKKIARTTTPILLERCRDTLQKFLYDEMRAGSIMMSQQRAEEVVFIMEKLMELEVYPDLLNEIIQEDKKAKKPIFNEEQLDERNAILKTTKGHLYLFIPLFTEFITSKEDMIKDALKNIFMEIASSKGIHENLTFVTGDGFGD